MSSGSPTRRRRRARWRYRDRAASPAGSSAATSVCAGASLYFPFIARSRHGEEIAQWRRVKRAASEAIVACGATITHHHAVGRDHAPYMEAEVGRTGLDVLRAVKDQLDPSGIMNPEKLIR